MANKTDTAAVPMDRDSIRAQIFSAESKKPKSKTIPFFGTLVELRQPTLGQLLDMKQTDDTRTMVLDTIVKYTYVPNSETRVFDDADFDQLASMPFSEDIQRLQEAVADLTGVRETEAKNV